MISSLSLSLSDEYFIHTPERNHLLFDNKFIFCLNVFLTPFLQIIFDNYTAYARRMLEFLLGDKKRE
jgi:hypothetical protein